MIARRIIHGNQKRKLFNTNVTANCMQSEIDLEVQVYEIDDNFNSEVQVYQNDDKV